MNNLERRESKDGCEDEGEEGLWYLLLLLRMIEKLVMHETCEKFLECYVGQESSSKKEKRKEEPL